jgi:hypothetical protein
MWAPRRSGSIALLCLCASLVSCRAPQRPTAGSPRALEELRGTVVNQPPMVVVPEGTWTVAAGRLRSPRAASAVLFVRTASLPERELRFRFDTGAPQAKLSARWDGVPLPPVRYLPPGIFEVAVPPARVAAGDHRLVLSWSPAGAPPLTFGAIRWQAGPADGVIDPQNLASLLVLSDFVTQGVIGSSTEKRGGVLALGAHDIALQTPASGARFRASVRLQAGGRLRAAVVMDDGSSQRELWRADLAAGEERSVELAVPAGERSLRLVGDPKDDAPTFTVWAEPRFGAPRRPRVPVILLVTLDTTRRDALGAYGAVDAATPALDRVASEGTLYLRASSTTAWTLPAHASIFTGLLPREHGAGVTESLLPQAIPTLAAALAGKYRTVGLAGGPLVRHTYGIARGFGLYHVAAQWEERGAELAERAIAILEQSADEPLFLFVNFYDPHYPYLADPERGGTDGGADPFTNRLLAGDIASWLSLIEQRQRLSAAGRRALSAAYAGEVSEMDRQLGRVLDHLRRSGRYDDALIVLAGDHGESLGEEGLWAHGARLEPEVTQVPLIVKFPRQRRAERVAELVSLVDVFPTILRAADVPVPRNSGLLLSDRSALGRRTSLFFEEHESLVHPFYQGIRLGAHLIGAENRQRRAVRWDGGEQCWEREGEGWRRQRCGGPGALAAELRQLELAAGRPRADDRGGVDDEERARLRALGYL